MLEQQFWTNYAAEGFTAVAIHVGPGARFAHQMYQDNGVTFPTLFDLDGRMFEDFSPRAPDAAPFPLHYVVDRDGVVLDVLTEMTDPEVIEQVRGQVLTALQR